MTAAKNRVSKRSGFSSGVIQWAKYGGDRGQAQALGAQKLPERPVSCWHERRWAEKRAGSRTKPPSEPYAISGADFLEGFRMAPIQ